jgi:hypothetical protein
MFSQSHIHIAKYLQGVAKTCQLVQRVTLFLLCVVRLPTTRRWCSCSIMPPANSTSSLLSRRITLILAGVIVIILFLQITSSPPTPTIDATQERFLVNNRLPNPNNNNNQVAHNHEDIHQAIHGTKQHTGGMDRLEKLLESLLHSHSNLADNQRTEFADLRKRLADEAQQDPPIAAVPTTTGTSSTSTKHVSQHFRMMPAHGIPSDFRRTLCTDVPFDQLPPVPDVALFQIRFVVPPTQLPCQSYHVLQCFGLLMVLWWFIRWKLYKDDFEAAAARLTQHLRFVATINTKLWLWLLCGCCCGCLLIHAGHLRHMPL